MILLKITVKTSKKSDDENSFSNIPYLKFVKIF